MMNEEEFDAFCNSLDKELDEEKKRQTLFMKTLEFELIDLSFRCYPEHIDLRNEIIEPLKEEAHESALMMSELMEYLVCLKPDDSAEDPEQYTIPYRKYFEDEEFEQRKNEFRLSCHEKVKEIVTKFFPELGDLSGNAIRNVNHSAYSSILNFCTAFIYLTNDEG